MTIVGVVPARYASSRFPGKPLALIQDKPMIQWVYEQCLKAETLDDVVVATDDERIFSAVEAFGGKVVMTSPDHRNGTERCAEVYELMAQKADFLINIQGDEPLIDPEQIDLLGKVLQEHSSEIATLLSPMKDLRDVNNPNIVKAARAVNGRALYFSRYGLPYNRDPKTGSPDYFKHIGIYGFRGDVLSQLVKLAPTPLELSEQLEQLRWLENGYSIDTAISEHDSIGVDSPNDIQIILNILENGRSIMTPVAPGEDITKDFLMRKGYRIRAQNWRSGRFEIDLIVETNQELVFVEVKTQLSPKELHPLAAFRRPQKNKIIAAANEYMHKEKWQGDFRFDLVGIILQPSLKIDHLEDAFFSN